MYRDIFWPWFFSLSTWTPGFEAETGWSVFRIREKYSEKSPMSYIADALSAVSQTALMQM
jgi:hypothetical protein